MTSAWLSTYAAQRPQSQALYAEAKALIAGGVGHDLRHSPITPLYIDHALGAHKWDVDGNRYFDYGMGNGALLIGHAHPVVLDAVRDVIGNGLHFGNDHPRMIEWARLIHDLLPGAEKVRFVGSGTEGSMLALRLARAFTKRNKLLRFEGHFSGWGDHVSKGSAPPFDRAVTAGIPDVMLDTMCIIPADLELVEDTLRRDGDIAALMLEPSGASWGTVPLTHEFNRQLAALLKKYNVPLIYDEVITGFRYSSGGYQKLVGVTPDLTVMGKIMTGGLPGGAIAGRADIMALFDYTDDPHHNRFERVSHLGTFNANPLSCAAGIATLKLVADGKAQAQADALAHKLRAGIAQILDELRAAAYVYGDSSLWHVYMLEPNGTSAHSAAELRTDDPTQLKSIPPHVIGAFQKNLQIRGVDLLSYNGGVTSTAHSDDDIAQTLVALRETLRVLIGEKIVGTVSA